MSESTLAIGYTELRQRVGQYLGWSTDSTAWSTEQADIIADIVRSGQRNFYFPASGHSWSFLHPTASITLLSGYYNLQLPDDFGHVEGPLTFAGTDTSLGWAIPFVNEGFIRQKRAMFVSATGMPTAAAIRPLRGTLPDKGQRFEIIVYPTPDQDYSMKLAYSMLPMAISSALQFAPGGAAHAETLIESCLAVAETRIDDRMGVHKALFQEKLAASMAYDNKLRPSILKYNANRSGRRRDMQLDWHDAGSVTVGGTEVF